MKLLEVTYATDPIIVILKYLGEIINTGWSSAHGIDLPNYLEYTQVCTGRVAVLRGNHQNQPPLMYKTTALLRIPLPNFSAITQRKLALDQILIHYQPSTYRHKK